MKTRTRCDVIADVSTELEKLDLMLEIKYPRTEKIRKPEIDDRIRTFHNIAIDGFGRHLPYEAIDDRTRSSSCVMVLKTQDHRPVGYTVNDQLTLDGTDVNYFATALTLSRFRGNGLYGLINPLRAISVDNANVLMTRTQNPIVYHRFTQVCNDFGLDVITTTDPIPEKVLTMAKEFSSNVTDDLICRNVYDFGEGGRALMYYTPEPQGEAQIKIWDKINVEKGDAILIFGVPRIEY